MGGNGVLLLLAAVLGFAALHFALRQRRLRRQLSQAAQQLAVILDGGSDEALLVPLCDDALTPLLGQIDRLLLETDSPYLAPVPFRGKRNDSRYLPYVAERIAAIKGICAEEAERITWENALRFFALEGTR